MSSDQARHGWLSSYERFCAVQKSAIIKQLSERWNPSASQKSAWQDSVGQLQRDFAVTIERRGHTRSFQAVLEYELPLEGRRPDAVLLMQQRLAVLEFKSASDAFEADIDQVKAYARDLGNYHCCCHELEIVPVLVPMRMRSTKESRDKVVVCSPDRLDEYMISLAGDGTGGPVVLPEAFLSNSSYQPLPALVIAARELFNNKRKLPAVWKSIANTDAAVGCVEKQIEHARRAGRRKLVFCTGVPGSGKTLVGLRVVHGEYDPNKGKQMCAYVSGNDPLVNVLHHAFKEAGGGGKVFVKRAQNFIVRRGERITPEQVIVFDEAQRAHDEFRVQRDRRAHSSESEPATLLDIASRKPCWSVVLALIGEGQAINDGEEGGIGLWREAVDKYADSSWDIVGPPSLRANFAGKPYEVERKLHLDETIRAHFASDLHRFAQGLVARRPAAPDKQRKLLAKVAHGGFDFYVTRDLEVARKYLRNRYSGYEQARYGLIASSRDKDLEQCGVCNSQPKTKYRKIGPWLTAGEENSLSCRHLRDCSTEFEIQGLELDAALLAWGTDFCLDGPDGTWSIDRSRNYKKGKQVQDAWQLRANAYLVLLTRARDATVVYVPAQLAQLDATYEYLKACGLKELKGSVD